MLDNYFIVGRQLENGRVKYLHSDDTIDRSPEKDGVKGTPLTVEYIGKTMVELSENPITDPNSAAYKKVVERIKHALVVIGPDGHDPNDPELEKIWDKTEIILDYDQRIKTPGETDRNIRKLVVPAADTLSYRQEKFADQGAQIGFNPPLTYRLDRLLMKLQFNREMKAIVTEFKDGDGNPLSEEIQKGLMAEIDNRLGSLEELRDDAASPTDYAEIDILQSPVSAFHRAVGVYITAMCN